MKYLISIGLAILLFSCSTFRETHYFKDNLTPTANYYKVNVRGSSFMSSSRYVSGYYDRGAVQAYFGELKQPPKGKFPLAVESQGEVSSTQSEDSKNKELVLLLSTNSDAIANGISNLVKSKTVVNSLALLANKDKLERSSQLNIEINEAKTDIELFIAKVDAYLQIDTSTTLDEEKAKESLKQLIKSELAEKTDSNLPDSFGELRELYLSLNN